MKSRIIFFTICGVILTASLYLAVRLIWGTRESSPLETATTSPAKTPPTGKHSELRLSHSTSERSAQTKPEATATGDVKSQAVIENNVTNLLKLYEQGQDEEFLKRLNDLIAANPTIKEYVALRGDYYYNEQNWAEASKSVDRLIELDPANLFARTTRGELQAILGKPTDALNTFEEVIRADPNNREALYGVLSSYSMMDKNGDGEKWIESYARSNPALPNAALAWADVLGARGDYEGRRRWLQMSLTQNQTSPQLYQAAGLDAAREGNAALAMRMFETSISYDHDDQSKLSTYEHFLQTALSANDYDRALWALDKQRELGVSPEKIEATVQAIKAQKERSPSSEDQ